VNYRIFSLFFILISSIALFSNAQQNMSYDNTMIPSNDFNHLVKDFLNDQSDTSSFIDISPHFNKPPQPSYFMVLLRRIGTPLFLKYVAFYTYVRNYMRWIQASVFGQEYYAVGSQHYAQFKA
jgi:hypothetical protein